MSKDLGLVSAYGYAKAGGYTGTEAEFTTMISNLENDASSASASATSALQSATTATNAMNTVTAAIGEAISIETRRYTNKYTVSSSTSSFTFNPTGYTYSNGDRFEVFVDGVKLVEDAYSNSNNVITLITAVSSGTVEIVGYKNVSLTTDDTLSMSGAAADAKATGDAIDELKDDLNEIQPLTEDIKTALLNCFDHVAWSDDHGQSYYDALTDALYPDTGLVRISAVFTQGSAVVYPSTPLNDLKAYLVVTGHYNNGTSRTITDYSLSGTLEVGTSTITVTKDGKTTTFNVTVSQPYWDYEWYASSEALPTYMTADYYDFTTESGAMFAKRPVLDFEYVGNCKLQIEIKAYSKNQNGGQEYYGCNNPQILIKNAIVSENQFRGIKIIMDSALSTASGHGMAAVSVNGTNALIPESNSSEYHVYDLTAENNVYTVTIDNNSVSITQNTNTSAYYGRTGITTGAYAVSPGFYGAFIKSIKFKRL